MDQDPRYGTWVESPADYRSELMRARDNERCSLFKNITFLGILLLVYNILNRVFVYVFYLLAYTRFTGSLTLDPDVAIRYIQENDIQNTSGFSMTANLFIVVMSALLVFLIGEAGMGLRLRDMIKPSPAAVKEGVKWTPLAVTFNILVGIIAGMITNMLNRGGLSVPSADFTIKSPSNYAIAMQLLYVCIVGPFIEELIYRGMIVKLISPYGKGIAVFMSALIFGLMHGNIGQAFSAFGGGLIYAMITVRYDSIAPTVVMHMLNNILASIPDISDAVGYSGGGEISLAIEIVLLFAGFYALFVMLITLGREIAGSEPKCALHTGERFKVIFLNPLLDAYFIYLIVGYLLSFVKANSGGQ